ncbi:LysE family transporter, partial [Streptomyces sp. NPDC005251]|uniref:LysE family translocator n=1 Tax=Streptomyces sp. NPDC005251 TaxID=3157166 RepID=UPI0033AD98B7
EAVGTGPREVVVEAVGTRPREAVGTGPREVVVEAVGTRPREAVGTGPREVVVEAVGTRPREAVVEAAGTGARPLRQGFVTNALNPKAPITFLSLLPQFVPAGSPAMPRTLLLALIVVVLALVWFPAVALLVDRLGRWLRGPRAARAVEAVMGGALTVLGVVLLLEPLRS